MVEFKENILGCDYTFKCGDRSEVDCDNTCDGMTKVYDKEVHIVTHFEDFTEAQERKRVQEVVAHEIFHAFCMESGLSVDDVNEEAVAVFFGIQWRKINNVILDVLDRLGGVE